ncbi:bifunctional oligoribonuclease/PAP phosphatase NrnA [uncultured Brachyspira sp.]|uniref:DHH family phosphoesterase n=1 Tax=uncultured Brachyspira sp. TaxID=221953 RepID=UPI0025CFCFB9|nr:bifunctional oligoribonuclease/PAP phosphatase NrnA [uncultured Brachyspira sp.]
MSHNKLSASKKDIIKRLSKADNITITGHRNPDSDCICSGLALSLILKNIFNKEAFVVNADKMQRDLQNIIFVDRVIFEVNKDTLPVKDVLVILDSGDIDRIGWIADITDEYNEVIFIDHHKVRNIKGVTMFYDDTSAGATCEIICDIFKDYLCKFDSYIATLLYCGICTDTGSFIFGNTTERTLLYGSKLMSAGIIQENLGNVVRRRYTRNDVSALIEIYRRMIIDYDKKIGYICLEDKLLGISMKELAVSASDTLIQMDDVLIGFIIHEGEDNFRVSIRSRCSKNIREVAESFGGGGHPKASGFSVSKNNYTKAKLIEEINDKLIKLLDSKL